MNKKYIFSFIFIFIVVCITYCVKDNNMAKKSRLSSINKQNRNISNVNNNRSVIDSNQNISHFSSYYRNSASKLLRWSQGLEDSTSYSLPERRD